MHGVIDHLNQELLILVQDLGDVVLGGLHFGSEILSKKDDKNIRNEEQKMLKTSVVWIARKEVCEKRHFNFGYIVSVKSHSWIIYIREPKAAKGNVVREAIV